MAFSKHWRESAMGVHVSPSWTAPPPPPSPCHPSGSSQGTSPEHPASCLEPGPLLFVSHLEKCLFSSLVHFFIGSFIFLELSCMNCLYIFEINSLWVASFAIIFSHSEGCLFTLLIVCFTLQKLLSLIKSHLFIFAFSSITLGGGKNWP